MIKESIKIANHFLLPYVLVNFVKLYQVKTFILKEALPEITARMTGEAIKRSKAYSTWIVYMAMLQELVTVLQDFGIDPRSNSMYDKLIGCPQLRAINDLTDRCMTSKTAADLQNPTSCSTSTSRG
jgi:hypothetical protein